MADAPFHCPPDPLIGGIIVDLPAPISVNRLWRASKSSVIKSTAYVAWIKRADELVLSMGQLRGIKTICGPFSALIVVKRSNLDIDNNSKCVLDYLQSRTFIENDKHCERLTIEWGEAPTGCRAFLKPWPTVEGILRSTAEKLEAAQ